MHSQCQPRRSLPKGFSDEFAPATEFTDVNCTNSDRGQAIPLKTTVTLACLTMKDWPRNSGLILVRATASLASTTIRRNRITYWTVEHVLSSISASLNVALESTRIQGFQKFKTAQEVTGDRHHGTPIVELATVLVRLV
jgi:hypothetical protein